MRSRAPGLFRKNQRALAEDAKDYAAFEAAVELASLF